MERREMIRELIHLKAMMLARGVNDVWACKLITNVIDYISGDSPVDAESKQKMVEKACKAYCEVCFNRQTGCYDLCTDKDLFRKEIEKEEKQE